MKNKRLLLTGILLTIALFRLCSGKEYTPVITSLGYGGWQFGEIVKGDHEGRAIDHFWMNQVFCGFALDARYSEHLFGRVGLEGQLWNPFDVYKGLPAGQKQYRRAYNNLYLTEVQGTYSFGNAESPVFEVTIGYFPFSYNPELRNFGSYLFRTATYPGLIFNDFDATFSRLLGLKASSTLLLGTESAFSIKQDLLLTSTTRIFPLYDYSLSYIATLSAGGLITIGGGVSFDRLLPISDKETTPHLDRNYWVDTTNPADTVWYSFAGTKVMARVCFDPKVLLPGKELFGKEDLKLYSEAAILGTQNYRGWYDTLWQRIPVMFGFNVPAFGVFDVLNIELEYYGCRYPMSYRLLESPGIPVPDVTLRDYNPRDYIADDWKYSFYLSKTFFNHITLTGQVARDHTPTLDVDGHANYFEPMNRKDHWSFRCKMALSF